MNRNIPPKEQQAKLCNCGCGEQTKQGNDFILGHNQRGKPFTQEQRNKVKENRKGIPVTMERRKQISETLKELYKNKENHPRWQGGVSLELYGEEFNSDLKEEIRKNNGHICQLCGKSEAELSEKLSIHHIDYNKQNNEHDNLIPLCRNCHTKTNSKHTYWEHRLTRVKKQANLDYSKAILCSDFHLLETIPTCRVDDFLEAQTQKLKFIKELQMEQNCPVIFGGDLFDNWKPSPYLLTFAIDCLPESMWIVAGNHDLPNHNIELFYKSGIATLMHAGSVCSLKGTHWGSIPNATSITLNGRKILVWHVMTWKGTLPWPGCLDSPAKEILQKYQDYDLILTGHNHKTFVEEFDGRILINPGSLTRHAADQEDHKPCVFLWDAHKNKVQQVFLPINENVISRDHIEHKKEHDKRISAFVEKLNTSKLHGFDFRKNLEEFENNNHVRKSVMDIVWKAVDQTNG